MKERRKLLANNQCHNNEMEGYHDPENYQGGRTFDSDGDRAAQTPGRWLKNFLDENNPESVIEIGPASGYHTRLIVEHSSVRRYHGIDINDNFLTFLETRFREMEKKNFEFSFHLSDFETLKFKGVDAIIFINSLHHIPNRIDLFTILQRHLKPSGAFLSIEPSHHIPRLRQLLGKLTTQRYLERRLSGEKIIATHHFCTLGEYKKITCRLKKFKLHHYFFDAGWKFIPVRILNKIAAKLDLPDGAYLRRTMLHRYLSEWICVVIEKI